MDFVNNIVKIPLAFGQGSIFSVHVAILMRWGCYHFQNATLNSGNSKSISKPKGQWCREKEGEREKGQGGHLLFLIRMDQSSFSLSHLFLFWKSSVFPPSNSFWAASKGVKWRRGGLSLQKVTPVKQGPTHACVFSPLPRARLSVSHKRVFLRIFFFPPQRQGERIYLFTAQLETVPVSEKRRDFINYNDAIKQTECLHFFPVIKRLW